MIPAAEVLQRTARRYRRCDRFSRFYVASKLRMDPVHAALLALAAEMGFGQVLDAGCGRGQVGVALLEAGLADSVLALDQDAGALSQLRHAAAGLALRAEQADLTAGAALPDADTVLLVDVLYQLETPDQLALVARAAQAARRAVIIRASDPAPGWRSALSAVLERLGRNRWPTFGSRSNPLPLPQLRAALAAGGYAVRSVPCAQGTPLAGVLLVGTRAG